MRAFIAFELPPEVKMYLFGLIGVMSASLKDVKWVNDEGLHITMKFLGEIEDNKVAQIKGHLLPIESKYKPLNLTTTEIDAFPNRKRARVIVVGLKNEVDIINDIFQDIENFLEKLGFEKESRLFKPHITLGRIRTPMPLLERFIPRMEEKTFKVEDLVLFKSTLTNKGAIYDPIWKIKLGGKDT